MSLNGCDMAMAEITYLRFLAWTPEEPKEGFDIRLHEDWVRLILSLLLQLGMNLNLC